VAVIFLFVTLTVLTALPAKALYLTMVPSVNVIFGVDWVDVKIVISNRGDEDALLVRPVIRLGPAQIELEEVPRIAFGSSHEWAHRFYKKDLGMEAEGTYPLFLLTVYHDGNKYPFSMPQVILVHDGVNRITNPLRGGISVATLRDNASGTISIRNPTAETFNAEIELFGPKEIKAKTASKNVVIAANKSHELAFRIQNFGALPKSRYSVFAVIQFEDKSGIHHSLVLSGTTHVERRVKRESIFWFQVIGGYLFITILFVVVGLVEVRPTGAKA